MKVSGFTFIKNALIYDYPIVEAILSILPLCDEVVVAVGKSDDDTLGLIQNIDSDKINIIETEWDETQRQGGRVLALETDKAFHNIAADSDWAIYIQGDEVLHEQYHDTIYRAMLQQQDNTAVDGLLFHYKHFYGSYDYVGTASNWYKHEIRIVRNNTSIYSYQDAQGFRKNQNEKLTVVPIDACIYHYGWVKAPKAMQRKQKNFNKYWHDDAWIEQHIPTVDAFDYEKNVQALSLFAGQHPAVMQTRIDNINWTFKHDISFNKTSLKDRLKALLKKYLGLDFSYKNYRIYRP